MRSLIKIGLVICSTALASQAYALDQTSYLSPGSEAHLTIDRFEQTILAKGSQTETDVRVQRLKVTAYESPYEWLQGGVHFGYMKVSHDDAAFTTDLSPAGEFFGLQLRSPRDYKRFFNLHWFLSYTYNNVDQEETNARSDMEWHDYRTELGAIIRLGNFQLAGGGYYAALEGDESASQTINSVTTSTHQQFKSTSDTTGAYAAIGYITSKKGRVDLEVRSGAQQGAAIIFSKFF